MKRIALLILGFAVIALIVTRVRTQAQTGLLNGDTAVFPWKDGTIDDAIFASNAGATIPLDSFEFTASKDGKPYKDVIVGRNPYRTDKMTTSVNVLVVPMIIQIGANTFDSTAPNNCGGSMGLSDVAALAGSPLFTPVTFDGGAGAGHAALVNGVNMGTSTYNDAHRRSEFLSVIGGPNSAYHTVYNITTSASQTIPAAVTAGHSAIIAGTPGKCDFLGGIDIKFFQKYFETVVLPAAGGTPMNFPIFLMHNVVFYTGNTKNCCIFGYHTAFGNPPQTYSPTDYDTTGDFGPGIVNVSIPAHEVGEWLDDPLANQTPRWGNIGQVGGCQDALYTGQANWEVGDPLTGVNYPAILMPNGLTYNPQETVFWGWFYSADHDAKFNIGAGGAYSMNGTFKGPSKPCPPGGTFPN